MQFWSSFEQLLGCYAAKFLLVATLFILKVQEKCPLWITRSLVFPVSARNSSQELLAWTPAAENTEDWGANAELEYLLLI